MHHYEPPPVPTTLVGLCNDYRQASGSQAVRIANRMLAGFPNATLEDVPEEQADSFLRLRATILDTMGNVAACRAIYQFSAAQAASLGDEVSRAAALAMLHVDRSLRQDHDAEHGSPYVGAIRDSLLSIADSLHPVENIATSDRILAGLTLIHLVHGLALMGATKDAQAVLFLAKQLPEVKLGAQLALAEAEISACRGLIEPAIEQAELILGYEVEDPLGLQIEVRQFLGTWYRAIGRHEAAATHLEIATNLCHRYDMQALGVTLGMELVSSLVALGRHNEVIDVGVRALDAAAELNINNEVVRVLDSVVVQSLIGCGRLVEAIGCAEIGGDRARRHADVAASVELYYLGAQAAQAAGDYFRATGLLASCAALSTGNDTVKAKFLRLQARQELARAGIDQNSRFDEHALFTRQYFAVAEALLRADTLLQEALALLTSTPYNEREVAAVELAAWNSDMRWLQETMNIALPHIHDSLNDIEGEET